MLTHMLRAAAGNTGAEPGEAVFTASGSWVVPAGVKSISAVIVGGGGGGSESASGGSGGGAGDLRYINNLAVTPGETLTITVGVSGVTGASGTAGGLSRIARGGTTLLEAAGGGGGTISGSGAKTGTSSTIAGGIGGGDGGTCANPGADTAGGGAGAGGYSGNGGNGSSTTNVAGGTGAGGGGGGGGGGGADDTAGIGGGVNVFGLGENGAGGAGSTANASAGSGGSFGDGRTGSGTGNIYQYNAPFGGGGAGADNTTEGGNGGQGAVRIVWPGTARSFPSTDVWMSRLITTVIETQDDNNTIIIPASAQVGDLAILMNMSETTGTQTDPSGWTRIVNQQTTSPIMTIWYRILTSGNPGSTVTVTTGTEQSQEMIVFRKASGTVSSVTVSGGTIETIDTIVTPQTQNSSTATGPFIVVGAYASNQPDTASYAISFTGGSAGTGNMEPSALFSNENGDTSRQGFMRFRIYDNAPSANTVIVQNVDRGVNTVASFIIEVN